MRLKYEKVIHHAIVNNLFRWQYTKKSCNAQGSSKYYLFVTASFKFLVLHHYSGFLDLYSNLRNESIVFQIQG